MYVLTAALFLVFAVYPAMAQIQRGSVGVVHFTKNEISVAADSHGIQKGRNGGPDVPFDDICKIAALGNDVVFVTTGTIGYPGVTNVPPWNNLEEAHRAYADVTARFPRLRGHVEEIGRAWAQSIVDKLNVLGRWQPDVFTAAISDGDLSRAMIGGQDANGDLALFAVRIFPKSGQSYAADAEGGPVTCSHDFCMIGYRQIAVEFADLTSERARREKATWKPAGKRSTRSVEYAMFRTMRLVELTIKYQDESAVGGPVDGVQLRVLKGKRTSIRWYCRKKNCAAN